MVHSSKLERKFSADIPLLFSGTHSSLNLMLFPVPVIFSKSPKVVFFYILLRVFENRVLRRIFVPERDDVTVEWRKLHNEELNDLYCSTNIVRVIKLRI